MKKYQKKMFSMLLIISIMFTAFSSVAIASPDLNEQNIEVKFRQIIEMPEFDDDSSQLLKKIIEAGAVTGWYYNEPEQRFERLITYSDIQLTVENTNVELNNNGWGGVLTQTDKATKVTAYNPIIDKTYTQFISDGSTDTTVIFDLDISPMLSIDKESMKSLEKIESTLISPQASTTDPYWSDGEKGVYGYRLHCNRFNGYLGNGTYYSNDASSQALLNFFGSDCDWALASYSNCLADYGSNPHCAASPDTKQASCSTLIGHYNRFHMRTSYSG
ncbi:MAG: hypothetical protein A2Y23_00915 [Clostridiales bacterium GWB2_37_7]|nr:MAG: hypothetical protein A2Y23_00915 [Clostridiales bacterium GWB2_37_7]